MQADLTPIHHTRFFREYEKACRMVLTANHASKEINWTKGDFDVQWNEDKTQITFVDVINGRLMAYELFVVMMQEMANALHCTMVLVPSKELDLLRVKFIEDKSNGETN